MDQNESVLDFLQTIGKDDSHAKHTFLGFHSRSSKGSLVSPTKPLVVLCLLSIFLGGAYANEQETVLYSFGIEEIGISNPGDPSGLTVDKDGHLYGTRRGGVFELSPQGNGSWIENSIYTP